MPKHRSLTCVVQYVIEPRPSGSGFEQRLLGGTEPKILICASRGAFASATAWAWISSWKATMFQKGKGTDDISRSNPVVYGSVWREMSSVPFSLLDRVSNGAISSPAFLTRLASVSV